MSTIIKIINIYYFSFKIALTNNFVTNLRHSRLYAGE